MPREMTVLVLGAGSSVKFKLPLGSELKTQLARDLNIKFNDGYTQSSGSQEIVAALRIQVQRESGFDINPLREAAVQIATKMPIADSIDEYIERHQSDHKKVLCAKLGIANCILRAEAKSSLVMKYDDAGSVDLSRSWISTFLNFLTRGKTKSALSDCFDNLAIINFNYDRCFEQFVFIWFQQMYDLSASESAKLCKGMKIFHPYGRLGSLPHEGSQDSLLFGADRHAQWLIDAAARIRTYAEANEEAEEVTWLESALTAARRFIFLGFAFHDPNLKICSPRSPGDRVVNCYASVGDEISVPRTESIEARLRGYTSIENRFHVSRGDCEKFWSEFGNAPLS